MKLEHKASEITTSKNFKEIEFGIKQADMGLVLEILRSKMYKNPIGAICREVASNSRDANREAENNVPIEIFISNSSLNLSDLTICFKDAGHGISPERMADVFVNYGSSTKRDSNEFTGGFGLGAKTPFSYTDNFSIETICFDPVTNTNIKYSYVAAIEEGRKGKIYLIDSVETVMPTGTTIIVPIKEADRYNFEKEVYRSTYFWPMRPTYKNFKINEINIESVYDDENIIILNNEHGTLFQSGYGLLLDGIFYNIDPGIINCASNSVYEKLYVFKFNVGDLTISANREALQYDDKTKAAINRRFVELINLCKDKYTEEFKTCDTWLKAILAFKQREQNVYYKLVSSQCRSSDPWYDSVKSYNGITLDTQLSAAFKYLQFFKCECDNRSKVTRTKITHVCDTLLLPKFLFDQSPSFQATRDATIFKTNPVYVAIKVDAKFYGWEKKSFKERKAVAKGLREILKDIKNLSTCGLIYSKYSTVDKMKVVKTPGTPGVSVPKANPGIKVFVANIREPQRTAYGHGRHGHSRYVPNSFYSRLDGLRFKDASEDIDPKDYAVQFVDDVWQQPTTNTEELQMLMIAMKAELIPTFKVIYTNKKNSFLLDTFETLDEKMKLLTPTVITQLVDGSHIHDIIGGSSSNETLLEIKFVSKTFADTVKILKAMQKNCKVNYRLTDELQKKYAHLSKLQTLKDDWNKIKETFPLIEKINTYDWRNALKDINVYVNLMENDLISKGLLK